jgi:hypothetical protein
MTTPLDLDAFRQTRDSRKAKPLESGAGGGDSGGMEPRIARLEEDVKELKADVKSLRADLTAVRLDVAWLNGRVEQLPTTWVMLTSIVGSMVALLGFTFIVLRYAIPQG